MVDLVIATPNGFGPLNIELITAGGERRAGPAILLSAARSEVTIRDLAPGEYAVIGTRPTGETLVEYVTLAQAQNRVQFDINGDSPQEFLHTAVLRGFVPAIPPEYRHDEARPIKGVLQGGERLFGASGAAGRALRALAAQSPKMDLRSERPAERGMPPTVIIAVGVGVLGFGIGLPETTEPAPDKPKPYRLRQWVLQGERWQRVSEKIGYNVCSDFLQVSVNVADGSHARAFGLIDDTGFGPIVVTPLFRQGLEITFLADGVMAEDAADRVTNPSAVRVPVAVAVPLDPGLADLLSALTAASFPHAAELWEQEARRFEVAVHDALDLLLHKFDDPAAAVLGAHFLARFKPTQAPIAWLENLTRLLPNIADAPTLLAWRLIAEGSIGGRSVTHSEIQALLRDAQRRPCCLFGRARAILTQAVRLYEAWPQTSEVDPLQRPRQAEPSDFLNVAAEAGGLEAFWGSNPSSPGRPMRPEEPSAQEEVIHLNGGSFTN